MNRLTGMAVAMTLLAGAITIAPAPAGAGEEDDFGPGQHPYGVEGSITQDQFTYLQGLAWPQSYEDIKNTFGFPTHRTEEADYYRLEESNTWVVIEYSGDQATGYRTE